MGEVSTAEEWMGEVGRRLSNWLAENDVSVVPPITVERLSGGHSNVTFLATDSKGTELVVRRPPFGETPASAHDMGREYRVLAALQGTDVPVPRVMGYSKDEGVVGAEFYVMSFMDGLVLEDRRAAERLAKSARRRAGVDVVKALTRVHAVSPEEVGLDDLGPPESYVKRQLRRWMRQWRKFGGEEELEEIEVVHGWLQENLPAEEDRRVVHGDFKLGNMIHGPEGEVRAVLDWELCTLGDPLADVAYLLRSWVREGEEAPASAEGFPEREDLVEIYVRETDADVEALDYYMVFCAWRSACILRGVYERYASGSMGSHRERAERFRDQMLRNAKDAALLAGV